MTALLAVSTAIDRINAFIGKTVAWLILVAVLVSAGNAVIRKTFNISSNGWLELQWYLYGAAFLLAAAYTLKENEHIRIDLIYGSRTRRTQHWIDLLGHLFFLMPFCLLMAYLLVPWALQAYRTGESSNNTGGLILWPARFVLAGAFVLLVAQGVSEIIKKIAIMTGAIPDPIDEQNVGDSAELLAEEKGA